jgi:sugar phosphate isomerase/epimerase
VTKPISQQDIQNLAFDDVSSIPFHTDDSLNDAIAPLKLSLSQLTTLHWSLAQELAQLQSAGFQGIGLWRPKLSEYSEQSAIEMLERTKIEVSSLSFVGGFTGGCGLSYLEAVADGREAVGLASRIGAKSVIVVGGSRNGHTIRHSQRMVVDGVRALADAAESTNVKLSILPMRREYRHRWTFLHTLDETLDLIHEIARPCVGLAFDADHLWNEPRILDRISEIVELVNVVQIRDCARLRPAIADRKSSSNGLLSVSKLIQTFQMSGFEGYFDIQDWSPKAWQSNYAHLLEQSHAAVRDMSLEAGIRSI